MRDIISELATIVQNPLHRAERWKEAGKGVIGCFPMYVPEEIIHASGMLAFTLPGTDETTVLANKYLQPYLCHPVRSNLELALKGDFNFLDGIIFPDICDQTQCLADIWELHFPMPVHHLVIPNKTDSPSSKDYLIRELRKLKTFVEACGGQPISDESLWHSINIYNQARSLLQKLYLRRRNDATWLSAKDIAAAVISGLLIPKEEHISLLNQLLEQGKPDNLPTEDKIRLVLSGNLCDILEEDISNLIEELGATVVDDDLYIGRRYFATLVPINSADPLDALAEHHLNDIPCPTKHHTGKDWADYLIQLARESQADGILIVIMKYCEPHAFDYPYLKERLSAESIPHLLLETEHTRASEQIRTRLQAFMEAIRSEKYGG